jgi:DNA-binding transcriptional MerR regulator
MAHERLTIDELAHRVGMTSRNNRAYQTRGLLHPPSLAGRTGFYDGSHVERLEAIKRMQDEGLNLHAVAWLLDVGAGAGDLRAITRLLAEPFAPEEPEIEDAEKLERRLGGSLSPEVVARSIALGTVEPVDDDTMRILLPTVVRSSEQLVALGAPVEAQLDTLEALDEHVRAIAQAFMHLAREHLLPALGTQQGEGLDVDQLREVIEQLRRIATDSLVAVFQRAMTDEVDHLVESPG